MSKDLVYALSELKENEALEIVRSRLDAGEDPLLILDEAKRAMGIVGKRFEDGTYFIPDLIYSGEILQAISEMVRPKMAQDVADKRAGKVVLGTVKGDIHDIGKNIVAFMLDLNGFEVYDIGIDIPPDQFVQKIRETGALRCRFEWLSDPGFRRDEGNGRGNREGRSQGQGEDHHRRREYQRGYQEVRGRRRIRRRCNGRRQLRQRGYGVTPTNRGAQKWRQQPIRSKRIWKHGATRRYRFPPRRQDGHTGRGHGASPTRSSSRSLTGFPSCPCGSSSMPSTPATPAGT